jgi:hypothetical protein
LRCSGHPPRTPNIIIDGPSLERRCRLICQIKFKNSVHDDEYGRLIPVFGAREFKRLGTIDEKAAAGSRLILNNPVSLAILANQEKRWPRIRGRFSIVFH